MLIIVNVIAVKKKPDEIWSLFSFVFAAFSMGLFTENLQ